MSEQAEKMFKAGSTLASIDEDTPAELVGKRIRSARTALGMTQEQFAEHLAWGVHPTQLSKYERGARETPKAMKWGLCLMGSIWKIRAQLDLQEV